MDIVLDRKRERVIHHRTDIGDIQPTCGNVGSDQQSRCSILEPLECVHAGVLVHVSMNGTDGKALSLEHLLDPGSLFFVQGKDQDASFGCSVRRSLFVRKGAEDGKKPLAAERSGLVLDYRTSRLTLSIWGHQRLRRIARHGCWPSSRHFRLSP